MDAYQDINEYMAMYFEFLRKECFAAVCFVNDESLTMLGPNGKVAEKLAKIIGMDDEANSILLMGSAHSGDVNFYSSNRLRKSKISVQCVEGIPVRIIRYEEGSEALQQEASGEGG